MLQINQIYRCKDINGFNQNFYKHLLSDQYLKVLNLEKTAERIKIKFDMLESDFSKILPESGLDVQLSKSNYAALIKELEKV